jgi:hypothetical protein
MRRLVRITSAVWLGSIVVLGCDSGDGERADATTPDAQTALATCDQLRGFDNSLVDVVNTSVTGINELSPDERRAALDEGRRNAIEAVTAWQASITGIELPDVTEANQLRDQLEHGSRLALDELAAAQQDEVDSSGPIPDDEVQGAVGIWFNSIEKVMSVAEPTIFKLERTELKQAFLDEPHCRNVIQMFVND